jgi:hypothetical protein
MSIGRVPGATGIQPSIVTAKGDLIVATASGSVTNQAVGSNNQVLMADSAQGDGVKWANEATATLTTTGDILYASAANTPARLGIGSTDQVLKVSGGVPAWGAAPSSTVTFIGVACGNSSSSQNISNNTQTAITWATETFDTDAFHSTSSNTSRITIPSGKNGYYKVGAVIESDTNTTGLRELSIYKNGSAVNRTQITPSAINPSMRIDLPMNLAVGDYIEVYYRQTSGSTQTPTVSGVAGNFYAYFIGA